MFFHVLSTQNIFMDAFFPLTDSYDGETEVSGIYLWIFTNDARFTVLGI